MGKLGYATALAVGAALMYGFDPSQGRRRRARLRDEADHLAHAAVRSANRAAYDAAHRAHGVGSRLRGMFQTRYSDDPVVAERVRACLGRCCSHPHAMRVSVENGTVELLGPVLADEAPAILAKVRRVAGVSAVRDSLERHREADHPSLQGSHAVPRRGLARTRWSPSSRWAVGGAGAAMLLSGMRHGPAGLGIGVAGALALLRATTNRPLAELLGARVAGRAGRVGRAGIDITKTVIVRAPVREVFDYFTAFENFPSFMQHIREVKRLDGDRWHWKVSGPAGLSFEWDAIVTRRVDLEYISWKSTDSASVHNQGEARFEPGQDGSTTRMTIRVVYEPPLGAIGHAVAKLLGVDPKHELDTDMMRFQGLFERSQAAGRRVPRQRQGDGGGVREDVSNAKAPEGAA
jgi:uncharacterized membrane protein